ncbi:MAG: hypothetical protein KIT35_03575 [Piscinibacter sp.]|nr:hypothetical protein [Piscinibacter sp.]
MRWRDGDHGLASLTLVATQTDFSEPGEPGLYIDESQLGLLEAQMKQRGYLGADRMTGTLQMLRSCDLLWSHLGAGLPDGRPGAAECADGLERGRHVHASAHARRQFEPALPAKRLGRGPLPGR